MAPVTIATWAQQDPVDFVTTATNELAGSSTSAGYGNPYNTAGPGQSWGPVAPQKWFGTRIPVDPASSFVIQPLQIAAASNTDLGTGLSAWQAASADQQSKWLDAYGKALADAKVTDGKVTVATGEYGPLPVMMANLLGIAQAGGLDGLLVINSRFYQTDYTQPLLFMGDGGYLSGLADQAHLTGSQWGMMNETGSYPGQAWLWLYALWYQVEPFKASENADILVMLIMAVLSLAFVCVPFIPGVRSIPRWIPVHRLIWREHYRAQQTPGS